MYLNVIDLKLQLCDCKDPEEFKKVKDRLLDWILDIGYNKISNVKFSERLDVANILIAHFAFYRHEITILRLCSSLRTAVIKHKVERFLLEHLFQKRFLYFSRCKAMIDQFTDGLNTIHSFWNKVHEDPALYLPFFVGSIIPSLTRQLLKSQCEIQYSEEMSNDRAIEESAVYAWETFLKNVEGLYQIRVAV